MKHSFKTTQEFEEFDDELPKAAKTDMDDIRDRRRGYFDMDYKKAKRWVKSFVGKHWDTLFSEWMKLEWIPERSRDLKHIGYVIELETMMVDGEVHYMAYGGYEPIKGASDYRGAKLYIHPKTKLVCITKPAKKEHSGFSYRNWGDRGMEEKHIIIKPFHQIVYIDGIWFEIEFYYDEEARQRRAEYEYKDKPVPSWSHLHPNQKPKSKYFLNLNVGGWSSYYKIKTKHQLNSKQLKHYGLKNGELRKIA